MGDQNDTRISLLKTITTEIEGLNSFLEEIWLEEKREERGIKKELIEWMFEDDFLGYIHESILESESSLSDIEVEEMKRTNQSLNVMIDLIGSIMRHVGTSKDIQNVLDKIKDIKKTILKTCIQSKVGG